MFFTKKKILFSLFFITAIGWSFSAYSDVPHPKDPNLGVFSMQKTREENTQYLPKLSVPYYEGMPERRTSEATMSKEDRFKVFRAAEYKDKKLEIEPGDMDVVIAQLKKEYEGKIKTSNRQNKNSSIK